MAITDKTYFRELLDSIREHIDNQCVPDANYNFIDKGVIIQEDNGHDNWNFVKECLGYDELMKNGKIVELSIDETWNSSMKETAKNPDARDFWNKLVMGAYKANHGLLVININNIKAFGHCWKLRQLVKQETPLELWPEAHDRIVEWKTQFNFDGYVIMILNGFSLQDARKFADQRINASEFDTLTHYCIVYKG